MSVYCLLLRISQFFYIQQGLDISGLSDFEFKHILPTSFNSVSLKIVFTTEALTKHLKQGKTKQNTRLVKTKAVNVLLPMARRGATRLQRSLRENA